MHMVQHASLHCGDRKGVLRSNTNTRFSTSGFARTGRGAGSGTSCDLADKCFAARSV